MSTPSSPALKLWIVLARAYRAVADQAAADIARHGLTAAEFGVLEALHHRGPMLLGEVQERILVSSGGVTYLADRLAARGLVERRDCPEDRRARYAALTPAGEELMRRIFPEHAAHLESVLGGLDEAQAGKLTQRLKKLGRYAAEHPRPAPAAGAEEGAGGEGGRPARRPRRRRPPTP